MGIPVDWNDRKVLHQPSALNAFVGSILSARLTGTAQAVSPTSSMTTSAPLSSSTSRADPSSTSAANPLPTTTPAPLCRNAREQIPDTLRPPPVPTGGLTHL